VIADTIKNVLDNSVHGYVPEYVFDKNYGKRNFRSDFAILKYGVLLEAEGIGGYKSRHTTMVGYSNDTEKYNLISILGFSLLRYTTLTDDPDKITSDIDKLINRIQKYNKHKQCCSLCFEPFYISTRLWIRYKTGYICLICKYLQDTAPKIPKVKTKVKKIK
jgi:very-short-patch-repair endonuclease